MNHPYNEIFLERQMELHRFVFHKFLDNEEYDFYSIVDTYLRTSTLRAKIDVGHLMSLTTGGKGPLISFDIKKCDKKSNNYTTPELPIVHFMANVYCMVQWMYNIPSKEIGVHLPAKELANLYDKYYSNSLKSACRDIYKEYLSDIKSFDELKEEEKKQNENEEKERE